MRRAVAEGALQKVRGVHDGTVAGFREAKYGAVAESSLSSKHPGVKAAVPRP